MNTPFKHRHRTVGHEVASKNYATSIAAGTAAARSATTAALRSVHQDE